MGGAFVPDQYETAEYGPVPAGDYPVVIEKAEVKDTKRGDGKYVWIQASVTGEQFKGKKFFHNFNILNPNQQAEEIGRRELASLGKAISIPAIQDTSELVDRSLIVKVKVKDEENEITAFKPLSGAPSAPAKTAPTRSSTPTKPAATTKPATLATPSQGAAKKMPWQK